MRIRAVASWMPELDAGYACGAADSAGVRCRKPVQPDFRRDACALPVAAKDFCCEFAEMRLQGASMRKIRHKTVELHGQSISATAESKIGMRLNEHFPTSETRQV